MPGLDHTHQHSSADIMQADNPRTPIDPSGVQTVRRIGPIEIAFDTPFDRQSGNHQHFYRIADLSDGIWVLKVAIHKLTKWNDSDSASASLLVDDADGNVGEPIGPNWDLNSTAFVYGPTNDYPVTGSPYPGAASSGTTLGGGQSDNVVLRGDGLGIWLLIDVGADDSTTGLLHVYALTAEPA